MDYEDIPDNVLYDDGHVRVEVTSKGKHALYLTGDVYSFNPEIISKTPSGKLEEALAEIDARIIPDAEKKGISLHDIEIAAHKVRIGEIGVSQFLKERKECKKSPWQERHQVSA